MVGALGVVFGDIGTSPIYTLQTVFNPADPHPVPASTGCPFPGRDVRLPGRENRRQEAAAPTGSFVARVEVTARALRDLERLFDFVADVDPRAGAGAALECTSGI